MISKQKYQAHKSVQRRRQAEQSQIGRDIGGLPPVKNIKRKIESGKSFRVFCETYFSKIFYLEWSRDHLTVIAKIERAILEGGLFAHAMPRGSGKTCLTEAACLWAMFYGYRNFVCLIGATAETAKEIITSIMSSLETNSDLADDFPEIIYPIKCLERIHNRAKGQTFNGISTRIGINIDTIILPTIAGSQASGALITAAGLQAGNIRGKKHKLANGKVARPDLVVIDDPQTRESAKSPEQTRQRLQILNGDVLGLAGPGKKISGLLTCTKIYDNDLADQILNRKKNPYWQGECTKLLYKFPANIKLWDEYAQIRAESLQTGGKGEEAKEFYVKNRTAMDEGSEVAWPQRKHDDELSALQHAMNLYYRDQAAFMAEYQNEPVTDQKDEAILTVDGVMAKINNRKKGEIPIKCQYLTMFCDVHDALIFYCVCAWEDDFSGYIIDYGTYPEQKRLSFTMKSATITLQTAFQGAGIEAAIQRGLNNLLSHYLAKDWHRQGGATMRIDRCFIDSGYKPEIVENVKRKLGSVIMSSRGVGLKAANKPMSSYLKKPGERYGFHWYIPNVNKTREFPYVAIDVNFWKSFVHERLLTAMGDKGGMTIFGTMGQQHALFADHIANSEYFVRTQGHGRVVHEWSLKPSKPDNHWFDCLVGCASAAAMCGCRIEGQALIVSERKRITLSEIQKQKRTNKTF